MMTPVRIILVPIPELASNKRVKGRPEPARRPLPPPLGHRWPLNHRIPDAEMRRHLDAARREIASSRCEIARSLRGGAV
jgi:hypothetical protein